MDAAKALSLSAVTGILAGLAACGGEPRTEPQTPSTSVPVPTERHCCKGRNECQGKSGCKTDQNASCAGQNSCRGRGTSCPKGG